MRIHGFNKTTLLDYPGRLACTIFLGGCNFRCPFCYNTPLVLDPDNEPVFSEEEILLHLKKRRGILEAVCVTGGEPTLHADLPDLLCRIRELGYLVKLDSNGYRPEILKSLAAESLIDYIAMDIKAAPGDYARVAGVPDLDLGRIGESAAFLMESGLDYEFRTTVVREFHTKNSFQQIGQWLKNCRAYYLQSFQDTGRTLAPGLNSCTREELLSFQSLLSPYIPNVFLRGID